LSEKIIYADNAATTKMSAAAKEAMLRCIDDYYGNPSSLHRAGQAALKEVQGARETISALLGCDAKELTFTSCASEADNQAIISAAKTGAQNGKKHIISTSFEHHAVLKTLEKLKDEGFYITLLNVHETGVIRPEELEKAIRPDTCLVSVMYANNEIGSIQPIEEAGRLCHEKGVLFHTDAVQAVGHIPIDVKKQNIDMLSLSAHKFHGPKGIGALYAKKGILLTSLINGGEQERGKRAGTENVPAIAAMAAALKEECENMDENTVYVKALRERLIFGLSQIKGSVLNGERYDRLAGNVNFCFEQTDGEMLSLLLSEKGICISTGSACASGSPEPSHVLMALGRSRSIAKSAVRISLCRYNTEDEIDCIISEVRKAVEKLRRS